MGIKLCRRVHATVCFAFSALLAASTAFAPSALAQCDIDTRTLVPFEDAVSISVDDLIANETGILPLTDWQPIFIFNMSGEESIRYLAGLGFIIRDDDEARSYTVVPGLQESDILEFAVFRDGGPCDERGTLNWQDDLVFGRSDRALANVPLRFNAQGQLLFAPSINIDTDPDPLEYDLDLEDFDMTNLGCDDGQNYILAFRSSATWRNQISLAFTQYCALMVLPDGTVPVGQDGLLDGYPEDPVEPETAYASSFGVFDMTSGPSSNFNDYRFKNSWAHPYFMYTPIAEYSRPRFDVGGATFDFVSGEFLQLQKLLPLENWRPVVAIDMHGPAQETLSPKFPNLRFTTPIDAAIEEVNVILTDIGGDPNGPPGNGGFNPTNGLETFTDSMAFPESAHINDALGRDFAYNGCWVWFDTNNDGFFDVPQPVEGGTGVTLVDHPMFPEGFNFTENPEDRNPGVARWEYIPFPPGGGDPWWKLRIRLNDGGRRRADDETPTGYLDATPDPQSAIHASTWVPDYFVVVRPDSGYQDSSGLPGDGVGLTYGADFRSFIEPRRFNPNSGHLDGGIFVQTQIPQDSLIEEGVYDGPAWQEDSLWVQEDDVTPEPWWNERTLNNRNAKPIRSTVEIHDLVLNYESNNLYSKLTDIDYPAGNLLQVSGSGFVFSNFARWIDPFGVAAGQFQDSHTVGVQMWRWFLTGSDEHFFTAFQYPYETVPFFQPDNDLPPFGPRSTFLSVPPAQPSLPYYDVWPAFLGPDQFPEENQFPLATRRGRYLKQHIETTSRATAMIGLNFTGADDPRVNQFAQIQLQQLTVAFWGPDFDPREDLLPLDPTGQASSSGVLLVEDGVPDSESTQIPKPYFGQDGIFGSSLGVVGDLTVDTAVPLTALGWKTAPEFIDLDGDGAADDMNGDNTVTNADKAWVLRMRPSAPWRLPTRDEVGGFFPVEEEDPEAKSNEVVSVGTLASNPAIASTSEEAEVAQTKQAAKQGGSYSKKSPVQMNADDVEAETLARGGAKAFGPAGNSGDDLFVVVRTSDQLTRFEQFRCVVPATLPDRNTNEKPAGVQLLPQTPISLAIYDKTQPEEGVMPYYGPEPFGYDMIEANVGGEVIDLTGTGQTIAADSGAVAVLGLDLSTNRGNAGIAAQGTSGVGGQASFSVSGSPWTAGAFVGYFLIDSDFEQWNIIANTNKKLTLDAPANASGTPKSGNFLIVKDPTFLEQVIVEFYDNGRDGDFNFLDDLLPMDIDPSVSGLALYRDNDNNPSNENGSFDEGDLPVQLDYAPFQIGQAGEVQTQLMMVFSTPGTDDIPISMTNQTRHRQWVPDSFGGGLSNPDSGADFFVVIRTSEDITLGDDFRVGLASWGPNTPTEPDPDTFPPPPASRTGEFDVFSEFPWGQRAVGLITFFEDETYYKQYPEADNSNFNWVRSTINKQNQTRTILTVDEVVEPDDLIIDAVTPSILPKEITGGGLTLSITGQNFGAAPTVSLDSVALTIVSANNTTITALIPGGTTLDTDNDGEVSLRVTNPLNNDFDRYNNFEIDEDGTGGGDAPTIDTISPSQGTRNDFPVTITGSNFVNPVVRFEGVIMPIQGTPTSTTIVVAFPTGGLPFTGALDVQVKNDSGLLAIKPDGFTYINSPTGGGGGGGFGGGGGLPIGGCFIATAAYGSPFAEHLDSFRGFRDGVLLKTAPGTALVEAYYTLSPALADELAAHPALAYLVRLVLTPVAWMIEAPVLAALLMLSVLTGAAMLRARRKASRASTAQ
ncbi:MAG: IPT/TIG domain-containing protein [Candidatus Hydrogenedentes bacterium]|nr:IPT/TIG domain-containing protein [Candidatus Hydrogenedentota bacterium]